MKDLSYTNMITHEKVTHQQAFNKAIKDGIVNIIMDEGGISEKSFSEIDGVYEKVGSTLSEDILEKAAKLYSEGKRIQYISEMIYDEKYRQPVVNESEMPSYRDFKRL